MKLSTFKDYLLRYLPGYKGEAYESPDLWHQMRVSYGDIPLYFFITQAMLERIDGNFIRRMAKHIYERTVKELMGICVGCGYDAKRGF